MVVAKFNVSRRKVDAVLSKFYMDGMSSINENEVNLERRKTLETEFNDYLRLYQLEKLLFNLKRSRIIKYLNKLGLLRYIEKHKI